jgi:large subunit ribosomal protein L13
MNSKTLIPKQDRQNQKWFLIDAEGKILGRLASRVATILYGKDNPLFTPHLDMGAYVVIVNAEKVKLTGMKFSRKKYYSYTGYPGGLKEQSLAAVMEKYPERVLHKAVKGMLPRNRLGNRLLRKLYIYAGGDHPHKAQKPEKIDF